MTLTSDPYNWLYERAEDACGQGLPLEKALQAVRDGYSSRVADYVAAQDLDEWPDGLVDLSKVQRAPICAEHSIPGGDGVQLPIPAFGCATCSAWLAEQPEVKA